MKEHTLRLRIYPTVSLHSTREPNLLPLRYPYLLLNHEWLEPVKDAKSHRLCLAPILWRSLLQHWDRLLRRFRKSMEPASRRAKTIHRLLSIRGWYYQRGFRRTGRICKDAQACKGRHRRYFGGVMLWDGA